MADVKWIKVRTDIFDDEKIMLIGSLPDGNSILIIWFKLLCLAGKQNNSGVFMLSENIAYTEEMLATVFRCPVDKVHRALMVFEDFEMVKRIDGVITLPNWEKHQSLDRLEERKNYMRAYMKKRREKQKAIVIGGVNEGVNGKVNVNPLEEEVEEE